MYFYSWFQSTRLVQRLMSHKNFFFCSGKVKVQPNPPPPPPSPATAFTHTHIITQQEHFLIFLSYLHTKSDFFERGGGGGISSNKFETQAKGQHVLFVCGHWGKKNRGSNRGAVSHEHANIQISTLLLYRSFDWQDKDSLCTSF